MQTKKEVKPLQVRLPAEVYESLQFVASSKGGTLNSVVVECLRSNLPETTWIDRALSRDRGHFTRDPVTHSERALDNLDRYKHCVLLEITQLMNLIDLRNTQLHHAINLGNNLRIGATIRKPEELGDRGTQELESMAHLEMKDTIGHNKAESKLNDLLKSIARARIEAHIEWKLFYDRLDRIKECSASPHEPTNN